MRATCALQLRQLSLLLLLLLLLEPCAGSGPLAASSHPPPRTRLSGATTAAAGPHGSPSPGVSAAAAAAAASRLPPWERESSVPWAPPVSSSTAEPAAGGHTSGPVIGSGYQRLRSSDIEVGTASSPTDNMDTLTTFSRSGERTLLSITNIAMSTTATESTASYTEMVGSADLTQHSSSVEKSRRNISSSDTYFTEPGMEPLIAQSSEIPTYSSSQTDPPAVGSSNQILSTWHMGKKAPSSHTDSVYISPTFSRGGERTLQLLTNNITSTDSLKITTSHTEIALSSDLTHSSASKSQTGGSNRSSTITDIPESSTGPLLIHSPSKSDLPAIEGSHQPISSSESEKKFASSHIASMYISTTSTRAGERTLQSLINSSRSSDAKEGATSGAEMSSSSYLTQSSTISSIALTSGINISLDATDFTELSTDPLLTRSPSASETASKVAFTRGGGRTLRSLTNSSTSPDVMNSSTSYLENTTSSDLTQPSSSVAQAEGSNVSSSDFSEPLTEPLLTHSSKIPSNSSSPNGLAAIGSSHQPISVSATEKRTSDLYTTKTYISTTFTRGGERTLRSLTNSSTSPDVKDSSTFYLENTTSSDLIQLSTSVAQAGGTNVSSSDFTESSVEALLTHSSKIPSSLSSPSGLAAIGSSHQPNSISATEKRTSDLHTSNIYFSTTFTRGGERTLRSLTNSNTSPDVTDSSTSYLENTTSSDLTQPSTSVAQAGGSNISSTNGSSHQPNGVSPTEKRTSDLHTTGTYISTTFTRGGGRTLRSLTNSSTSPDVTDSSTSYLENTTSSDLTQPSTSVAQAGGSNISSSEFSEPLTKPLLTHSSRISSNSTLPNGLSGGFCDSQLVDARSKT
ncbi:uncharacterized protein [Emydura macquarii macquarii]|uniref:uncharacterized protein n=1 Tax=Emydura macquarii macquarii TaxID=1129001 RepID=UPI00352A0F46